MNEGLPRRSSSSAAAATAAVFPGKNKTAPKIRSHGKCFACELLLAEVSPEQRPDFDALVHDRDFAHANVLYRVTAPIDAVYFIQKGAVKLVKAGSDTEQRIVRVLNAGDVAGIESVFSHAYAHTAIALGDVTVCSIPVAWLRKFAAESGRTQMWLLQKSLTALNDVETWLAQLAGGSTPARTRMARLMLQLRTGDGDYIHRLAIKEMGAIVGLAPETVCRIISEFDRHGFVVKDSSRTVFSQRYFHGNIPALKKIAHEF
ncbi:MAG: Crp/Fnr family transcriptional regulator [Sterolibacterium sp.]